MEEIHPQECKKLEMHHGMMLNVWIMKIIRKDMT